jgi:hypothetical protein
VIRYEGNFRGDWNTAEGLAGNLINQITLSQDKSLWFGIVEPDLPRTDGPLSLE